MLDLDICSSFARNLRRKDQPNPSDCPDPLTADALPGRRIHAQVGTIVRSEQSALFRRRNNADSSRPRQRAQALAVGCISAMYAPLGRMESPGLSGGQRSAVLACWGSPRRFEDAGASPVAVVGERAQ